MMWGITLIADGTGTSGNHAVMIIEGVNEDGEYFMHSVEFTGRKVISEPFDPSSLSYDQRTQIWKVPSERVKVMLEVVEEEKKRPIGFSLNGSDSIFSGGKHNCFTWIRKILEISEINLGKSIFGFLITSTKDFTHKECYFKYKKVKNLL